MPLLADPNLWADGDRFYLFPTTDGIPEWAATSFRAYSSPDLVHWDDHGVILALGTDVRWVRDRAWAPTIATRSGKYFFYFSADDNIGVAVGDSPTGPFDDIDKPLVASGDFEGRAIDPSTFTDVDGTVYLLWGNEVAHIVPLGEDMVSFDPREVRSWVPTGFREAAWIHRRDGIYYLSWSVNDTRSPDYQVHYASAPSPYGPWSDHGVLLEQAPERDIYATGHHSITNVPGTDEWVIAYHRFAIPDGDGFHREVVFDRLIHRADGSIEPLNPSIGSLRFPLHPPTE
ncbi:family 43 glycosylhydrolase [Microbacterium sp.]|uniref:family 43 glycosylhydrolase n=1 Tax=Microbacterium sp. TaxID=51671 RepID=UPI002B493D9B|nr:family 43 glycosylhydrolase [Microbacterium sp.]